MYFRSSTFFVSRINFSNSASFFAFIASILGSLYFGSVDGFCPKSTSTLSCGKYAQNDFFHNSIGVLGDFASPLNECSSGKVGAPICPRVSAPIGTNRGLFGSTDRVLLGLAGASKARCEKKRPSSATKTFRFRGEKLQSRTMDVR